MKILTILNTMLIFIDKNTDISSKKILSKFGEIVEFETKSIVYDAISNHPDIFFCPTPKGLIVAPNTPKKYFEILDYHKINYFKGNTFLKNKYPHTAHYNSLCDENLLIFNPKIIDSKILELCDSKTTKISVNQGYIRCNLIHLKNNNFITSDKGIFSVLKSNLFNVLYINPENIELHEFKNGFFGGICGYDKNKLFVNGSLSYFAEIKELTDFLKKLKIEVIELNNNRPVDIGTIMLLQI